MWCQYDYWMRFYLRMLQFTGMQQNPFVVLLCKTMQESEFVRVHLVVGMHDDIVFTAEILLALTRHKCNKAEVPPNGIVFEHSSYRQQHLNYSLPQCCPFATNFYVSGSFNWYVNIKMCECLMFAFMLDNFINNKHCLC